MKTITTFILMLITTVLLWLLGSIAFVFNVIRKIYRRESLVKYFLAIVVSTDQHGGTVLFATEDFTISSSLYKLSQKRNKVATIAMNMVDAIARVVADGLYKIRFIDKDEWIRQQTHCKSAYVRELEEFRLKCAKSSVAMLEYHELIAYFEDDTFSKFHRYLDDGIVRALGWCCDFHIVKDGKIYLSGKKGDGIIYNSSNKNFEIEGD
jgi:hypothetical protein